MPWLFAVRFLWGQEVSLLNISKSGILVECSTRFTPGSGAEFQLCGTDQTVVVSGRFVRSEIAAVDTRGVKYHAAAVFENEVDLRPCPAGTQTSSRNNLARWLHQISMALDQGVPAHVLRQRFEQGLRKMVAARDIEIRDTPIAPEAGGESIYFKVPVGNGADPVLQATFEQGSAPSGLEFRLLQAASALAGVVLRIGCDRD